MTANSGVQENRRVHPYKFTLWVAIGSICMMFAAMTSAYIVKRNQSKWLDFDLPVIFWYSTVVILLSSLTIYLALKAFKARERSRYRTLITLTAFLGVLFTGLQFYGFGERLGIINLNGMYGNNRWGLVKYNRRSLCYATNRRIIGIVFSIIVVIEP